MLQFRSPHLTSQRIARGWTRPRWVVAGWCFVMVVVLPLTLIGLGVHYEWFDQANVLYEWHDAVYLPLRGWLVLKPWPYCLIPLGYLIGIAGALAAPFLIGRSPLKQAYLWCARFVLLGLTRLPYDRTEHFFNWWQRWGRSRHAVWPLLADEMRVAVRQQFDARPDRRAWWLAELIRWTALTIQLRRLIAMPVEPPESFRTDCLTMVSWFRKWFRGKGADTEPAVMPGQPPTESSQRSSPQRKLISEANSLSRDDRIRNARAWTEAVVRLAAVSTEQAEAEEAGRPALLTGQWKDVFRSRRGTVRERATLAWYLIRRQPHLTELVEWLRRDASDCVTEEMELRSVCDDAGFAQEAAIPVDAGLDFESAARDVALLVPILTRLGSQIADVETSHDAEQAVDLGDRHGRQAMLGADARWILRRVTMSTMRRRRLVEQILRELEARVFHPSASVTTGETIPLEGDREVGALCLDLALVPALLTGEPGPLVALLDAIDAFHLMWSLANANATGTQEHSPLQPRTLSIVWSRLSEALDEVPRSDIRSYCRELQGKLFARTAASVSGSALCGPSVVRSGDLGILHDRGELVDRVSTPR